MATRTLDITLEHCPMTFVKTKLELEQLGTGETLEDSMVRSLRI